MIRINGVFHVHYSDPAKQKVFCFGLECYHKLLFKNIRHIFLLKENSNKRSHWVTKYTH